MKQWIPLALMLSVVMYAEPAIAQLFGIGSQEWQQVPKQPAKLYGFTLGGTFNPSNGKPEKYGSEIWYAVKAPQPVKPFDYVEVRVMPLSHRIYGIRGMTTHFKTLDECRKTLPKFTHSGRDAIKSSEGKVEVTDALDFQKRMAAASVTHLCYSAAATNGATQFWQIVQWEYMKDTIKAEEAIVENEKALEAVPAGNAPVVGNFGFTLGDTYDQPTAFRTRVWDGRELFGIDLPDGKRFGAFDQYFVYPTPKSKKIASVIAVYDNFTNYPSCQQSLFSLAKVVRAKYGPHKVVESGDKSYVLTFSSNSSDTGKRRQIFVSCMRPFTAGFYAGLRIEYQDLDLMEAAKAE